MGRKPTYDEHGDKIGGHEHKWYQETVTLQLGIGGDLHKLVPVQGAQVTWRCSRRGCLGARVQKYRFRRPRIDQQPNAMRRGIEMVGI